MPSHKLNISYLGWQDDHERPECGDRIWPQPNHFDETDALIESDVLASSGEKIGSIAEALVALGRIRLASRFEASLSATIGSETKRFHTIDEKIDALEESWVQFNGGRSITSFNHFSYYQIIGLGAFAVPSLLEKVKAGSNHWFVALQAISGVIATTPEMQGDSRAARDAWIQWGERHVYSANSPENVLQHAEPAPELESRQRRLEHGKRSV